MKDGKKLKKKIFIHVYDSIKIAANYRIVMYFNGRSYFINQFYSSIGNYYTNILDPFTHDCMQIYPKYFEKHFKPQQNGSYLLLTLKCVHYKFVIFVRNLRILYNFKIL